MGSLAQISSGAIRRSFNTRFRARFRRVPEGARYLLRLRRVSVQIPGEVLGGFRFWRVPVQIPVEVPEGFGAASRWGSGGFRCRYRVEVPVGSGADSRWGSGGFRCRYSVRFRKVRVQMLCEVPEGSDVFDGINFYFFSGQKRWKAVYDAHILVDLITLQEGGRAWQKRSLCINGYIIRPSALQTETKFWRNETAT